MPMWILFKVSRNTYYIVTMILWTGKNFFVSIIVQNIVINMFKNTFFFIL